MEKLKGVILKPGKEKAIKNRHHWIFSGAIANLPAFQEGSILPVYSYQNELLGSAYFNSRSSIRGRMVAFGDQEPLDAIKRGLMQAIELRQALIPPETTAYRLVNAEGDFLPGLIIDRYGDILVVQIATLGMERQKEWIVSFLSEVLSPKAIYEKSNLPSRKEEGLAPCQQLLFGSLPEKLIILENGLQFSIHIEKGQKTGFFLDQREMRARVRTLAKGKKVLNCFSYTGGFSLYALAGGASRVDSVDISQEAMDGCAENFSLNGYDPGNNGLYAEDVFEFLRASPLNYDIVILDPPAFAKRAKDQIAACRGYKDINRLAMQKMPPHSILITCSCSYYVDSALFQKVVFQAAVEAKREVRILEHHRQAYDHPVNICHPEGEYLKSLVLEIA